MFTCNLALGRPNQEDCALKYTVGNTVTPCLKKIKQNHSPKRQQQSMWGINSQNTAGLFNTSGSYLCPQAVYAL